MSARPRSRLVHESDPVLRQKAWTTGSDAASLVRDLFHECERSGGVGLAAPQIGVQLRVAIVAYQGLRIALVDPELRTGWPWDTEERTEGCLSLPGRSFRVKRPRRVQVTTFVDREHPLTLIATGMVARVVMHEVDHLDGRCIDIAGVEIGEAA